MGHFTHHAILVTGNARFKDSPYPDYVKEARDKATELGLIVTDLAYSEENMFVTFAVVPDGGKEYGQTSDKYDDLREAFIQWLWDLDRIGWGLRWVEVSYGDESGDRADALRDDGSGPEVVLVR